MVSALIMPAALNSAVRVSPGDLDHFVVKIPDRAISGENFVIRIEPRDAFDNLITDYSRLYGTVKLTSGGKGKISTDAISPSDFFEGVAQILVSYDKSEAITITATEELTKKAGSAKIALGPGAVDHFSLSAQSQITAGQKFQLKIEARDIYGNMVADYNVKHSGVEINAVVVNGEKGRLYPNTVPGSNFTDGIASIDLVYEKTGSIMVSTSDLTEKAAGKTSPILVLPGDAKRFTIILPDSIIAGKPFNATIKVYDAFDNLVTNYNKVGKGVALNPQTQGKLSPEEIPASAFADGIANVSLSYNKAEVINPVVTEKAVRETVEPAKIAPAPVAQTEKPAEKAKITSKTAEKKPVVESKTKVAAEADAKKAADLKASQDAAAAKVKLEADKKAAAEADAKKAADLKTAQDVSAKAAVEADAKKAADLKAAQSVEAKATADAEAKKAADLKTAQDVSAKAAADADAKKAADLKAAQDTAVVKAKPAEVKPAAAAVDPKIESKNCYDRAVKSIGQRNYSAAKTDLEKCLSLDPTNADAKRLLDRVNIIMRLESK